MKNPLRFILFFAIIGFSASAQAQQALIHYWNFDNTPTATITPATPAIPDITADYSALDKTKARVTYYLIPGTSLTASKRYIDPVGGVDSINARFSVVPTGTGGNFGLRLRNPLDSMELRIFAPTTGFTGITMKYALQSSSTTNGDSTDWFDYSIDGGTTWKGGIAGGMKVNSRLSDTVSTLWNTYQGDANWGLVTVDLSADKSVENNPNFVFRIRFRAGADHKSGNNRLDNMTFEGVGGSGSIPATITLKEPGNSSILVSGRHAAIAFDTANGVEATKTIEYSIDGGTTWSAVGTTSGTTYDWVVPNTPTTNGVIHVNDGKGTIGTSAVFTIVNINPKTNRIIHYWDFNSVTKVYSNPNIPPFPTDFSANENAPGSLAYTLVSGTPSNYAGYIDNVAGDTATSPAHSRFSVPPGQALRVRNPTDAVELRFNIPTNGFKNISFSYAIEESSNISPLTRNFDYSVDGGTTWQTTGLSILSESNLDSAAGKFDPVKVNFASGSPAENNSKLIFRIKMTGGLNKGTSGNDRYDNIVVEGDPIVSSVALVASNDWQCFVYPNPSKDQITISTRSIGLKNISVIDIAGKTVLAAKEIDQNILLTTAPLTTGIYTIIVADEITGKRTSMKFVKE